MIKSDLLELIEYLETESNNLTIQKNDCLQQWDYEGAHYFSIALQEVNHQFNTLYKLNDLDFDARRHLELQKSLYDPNTKVIYDDSMKSHFENKRKELDKQIQKLNEKPKKQTLDGQEFDDTVYELLEKRIAGFKFHLIKEDNLYIDFQLQGEKNILISIYADVPSNNHDNFHVKQKLAALGFIYNKEKGCMEYFYDLSTFKNSFAIKILVSRVVFEVLHYRSLDNPAYIEKY